MVHVKAIKPAWKHFDDAMSEMSFWNLIARVNYPKCLLKNVPSTTPNSVAKLYILFINIKMECFAVRFHRKMNVPTREEDEKKSSKQVVPRQIIKTPINNKE